LLQLIKSNLFSILYYNSEVWHLHSLKQFDKKLLLSALSNPLKLAIHYSDPMISLARLHILTSRATPQLYSNFKLALLLYRTFNNCSPETEWVELNFAQSFSSRQTFFHVNKTIRL
jgi:hypothetical protein